MSVSRRQRRLELAELGFELSSRIGSAFSQSAAGQRSRGDIVEFLSRSGKAFQLAAPFLVRIRSHGVNLRLREAEFAAEVLELLIAYRRIIQRQSVAADLVYLLHCFVELRTELCSLFCLSRILRRSLYSADAESFLKLLENCPFLGFIRVELETEGSETYLIQPLFNDLQRCHFLGDEKHRLAVVERICYHICYSLGFACSGRSVQDEAVAGICRIYRCKLGRIRRYRNCQIRGSDLVVEVEGTHLDIAALPLGLAGNKARNDLVLRELICAVADIVPHDESVERELSDEGVFLDIPARTSHYALTDGAEYQRQVNSVLVHGNGVEPLYVDAEELSQHFEHGDVHLRILVADGYRVGLVLHAAVDVHRYQHERRIAGLFALVGLEPAQESQCEVYRIRAVFLDADLCLTVELLHYLLEVGLVQEGAQTAAFELGFRHSVNVSLVVLDLEYLAVSHLQRHIIRNRTNSELLAARYLVLEQAEVGYHDLHIHR